MEGEAAEGREGHPQIVNFSRAKLCWLRSSAQLRPEASWSQLCL